MLQIVPIAATWSVEQHDRDHVPFAGLKECQHFQCFVECAKPSRQTDQGMALFHEHQLAREKVLHVHQFMVTGDDRIRFLFKGEQDVEPHRVRAARSQMPRFHDATGGTRHHEPVLVRHGFAELHRLLVGRFVRARAGRPEDRDFAMTSVRGKDLEGVTQFTQCPAQNLQITTCRPVAG